MDFNNVKFLLQPDVPRNLVDYLQESERAGQDGQPGLCTIFAALAEISSYTNIYHTSIPSITRYNPVAERQYIFRFVRTTLCRRVVFSWYIEGLEYKTDCETLRTEV